MGALLTLDAHPGPHLGHAGLTVGEAVDFDQAVETDAHHAKRPARAALDRRRAEIPLTGPKQGGGNRIALLGDDRLAIEFYGDLRRLFTFNFMHY